MINHHMRVRLIAVVALGILLLAASSPAPALNLGTLAGDAGPQLAKMVADKLGLKVPGAEILGLLNKDNPVSGLVSDPSKLLDLGVSNVSKGDVFNLVNKGEGILGITPKAGGDGITQKISSVFGPLSSMFK
jgi:hypothetical protein